MADDVKRNYEAGLKKLVDDKKLSMSLDTQSPEPCFVLTVRDPKKAQEKLYKKTGVLALIEGNTLRVHMTEASHIAYFFDKEHKKALAELETNDRDLEDHPIYQYDEKYSNKDHAKMPEMSKEVKAFRTAMREQNFSISNYPAVSNEDFKQHQDVLSWHLNQHLLNAHQNRKQRESKCPFTTKDIDHLLSIAREASIAMAMIRAKGGDKALFDTYANISRQALNQLNFVMDDPTAKKTSKSRVARAFSRNPLLVMANMEAFKDQFRSRMHRNYLMKDMDDEFYHREMFPELYTENLGEDDPAKAMILDLKTKRNEVKKNKVKLADVELDLDAIGAIQKYEADPSNEENLANLKKILEDDLPENQGRSLDELVAQKKSQLLTSTPLSDTLEDKKSALEEEKTTIEETISQLTTECEGLRGQLNTVRDSVLDDESLKGDRQARGFIVRSKDEAKQVKAALEQGVRDMMLEFSPNPHPLAPREDSGGQANHKAALVERTPQVNPRNDQERIKAFHTNSQSKIQAFNEATQDPHKKISYSQVTEGGQVSKMRLVSGPDDSPNAVQINVQGPLKITAHKINEDTMHMMKLAALSHMEAVRSTHGAQANAAPSSFTLLCSDVETARTLMFDYKQAGIQLSKIMIKDPSGQAKENEALLREYITNQPAAAPVQRQPQRQNRQ